LQVDDEGSEDEDDKDKKGNAGDDNLYRLHRGPPKNTDSWNSLANADFVIPPSEKRRRIS
jgi:hypothetical protein